MKPKKKPSRLSMELVEMAQGQHRAGIMDGELLHKITVRHLGEKSPKAARPISARQIRALRQDTRLSQAAFARYLNLTAGYVSQLERGAKEPKGSTLALFNVIRHKGIEAVL